MRGGIPFVAASLLLTVSLLGATLVVADEHDPDFLWEAPSSYQGDLVAQLTFEPTAESFCWFTFGAAGSIDPSSPVLMFLREAGGSGGSLSIRHTAQVHANDFEVDTRQVTGSGGNWAASFGFGRSVSEPETWLLAASNVDWWSNGITGTAAVFIEIDCEDADVTTSGLGGSGELETFRDDSMEGIGGSALFLFSGAKVQVGDSAGGSFTTQSVIYSLSLGFSGAQVGELTIQTPKGQETYDISVLGGTMGLNVGGVGGPGDYRTQITRAAVAQFDFLIGVYAGVDPVGDLDELL